MKIKVAIDLSPLYSKHQFRGIGFYTKRLIEALQVLNASGIELEFVKSTDKLRFLSVDLIHYPYFTPFFLSLPSRPLAASVVTIHDLMPVRYANHTPPGLRGKIRWQIQKKRLKKVKAIITDSQTWCQGISKLTGFPKEKIFVVPLAAGKEFKVIKDEKILAKIKRKCSLPEKFILYVGDVNWNKNVNGLIKAFAKFKTGHEDFKLVLAGKAFQEKNLPETKAIIQLIKSLGLNSKIKRLGYLPTEDLVGIYNLATVYCQPSFDEGFGLPVLEAMVCGCPVVAAKAGSLPEVCGKAAVMVKADDINSIAEGIKQAIENREKLIKRGFEQARQFSWKKTAKETIVVYKQIFANGRN